MINDIYSIKFYLIRTSMYGIINGKLCITSYWEGLYLLMNGTIVKHIMGFNTPSCKSLIKRTIDAGGTYIEDGPQYQYSSKEVNHDHECVVKAINEWGVNSYKHLVLAPLAVNQGSPYYIFLPSQGFKSEHIFIIEEPLSEKLNRRFYNLFSTDQDWVYRSPKEAVEAERLEVLYPSEMTQWSKWAIQLYTRLDYVDSIVAVSFGIGEKGYLVKKARDGTFSFFEGKIDAFDDNLSPSSPEWKDARSRYLDHVICEVEDAAIEYISSSINLCRDWLIRLSYIPSDQGKRPDYYEVATGKATSLLL